MAIVMENVEVTDAAWDSARFARAAYLLGRLNARLTLAAVGDDLGQLLIGLAHAGEVPVADLPGSTVASPSPVPVSC